MNDSRNRELSDADLEHVSAGKQQANPIFVGSRRGAGRAASPASAPRASAARAAASRPSAGASCPT